MDESALADLPFGSILLNTDWDKILETLQNWLTRSCGNRFQPFRA